LVTSIGTLGKLRDAARRWLAQRAELVFAARLPIGTFDTTQASADLLVFRRHIADVLVPTDAWINTSRLSSDFAEGRPLPSRRWSRHTSSPPLVSWWVLSSCCRICRNLFPTPLSRRSTRF
jgi:hypothetical protein